MRLVATTEIQQSLSLSKKETIKKLKTSGAIFHESKGGFRWEMDSLPLDIQLCLASDGCSLIKPLPQPESFVLAPEKNRKTALIKAALIDLYEQSEMKADEFIELYNAGQIGAGCFNVLFSISVKTFYRWIREFKDGGVDALLPRYGENKKGGGSRALNSFEKGIAQAMFLNPNKWSISKVHREMQRIYGTTASLASVSRFLKGLTPSIVSFHRDGRTKFEAHCLPYIKGDPARFESMEMITSDHHNWDLLVSHKGKIFRPWSTVFQDRRSRKVLAWSHSVYPSTVSITEALYGVVVNFGCPKIIHIDNGKDYRGQILNGKTATISEINNEGMREETQVEIQGIFASLGCKVIFALPYHGQSKDIERAFGTFAKDFATEFPTYVGSNTVTRPDDAQLYFRRIGKLEKKEVIITFDAFKSALAAYIEQWNATWKHSGEGMHGRTPNEIFYENWRTRRDVPSDYLELAFAETTKRKVLRNGITIDGVMYSSPDLCRYTGTWALVKRTFSDMKKAMVFSPEGAFLCYAWADLFAETGNLAADNEKIGHARKVITDEIKKLSDEIPELPEGGRGAVDFALKNKGIYDIPQVRNDQVRLVVNGNFELPPPPSGSAPETKERRKSNDFISPLDMDW